MTTAGIAGRKVGTRLPELHSIHQVEILNAFHDGIFVRIPGYEADGLIHHSQISRNLQLSPDMPKVERFRKIEALVGDVDYSVYVKVVYVADLPDHLKCECSLKMVRPPCSLVSVHLCLTGRVLIGAAVQVSQKTGADMDPQHKMWLDYMRKRRSRGAGSFTAPNMRAELDRVARLLDDPQSTPGDRGRCASPSCPASPACFRPCSVALV